MGLSDSQVVSVIAVSDMDRARKFYEGVLGLSPGAERPDGGIRYECGGDTSIHVYPSPDHAGKSTATLVGFEVADIETAVDELVAAGATFEQYDLGPIQTNEKGIAQLGDARSAWLRDPDGNTMSVIQE